ncbi:caspase family protein [Parahaliea mediterranea]|uniref:caspase family protein n=1 Tax=Parahaliea mediterranea TaxID=651086 RepID=UPI000E2ECF78|nr:caspase family protein [Parahaliea mediterranea]
MHPRLIKYLPGLLCGLLLGTLAGATATAQAPGLSSDYGEVDAHKPVLCLLPGRVRKVGSVMTYLERRKPQQLTATECEIRGGEYTFYDRANYENALAIWREAAEGGDATAQLYVGEIFEKGWLGTPDYAQAAHWYGLAVAQGDARAQRRMAYFYEQGLGVAADKQQALSLWREALDLGDEVVLASQVAAQKSEAQREIDRLVAALEQQNATSGRLQRELAAAQASLAQQADAVQHERAAATELQAQLAAAASTQSSAEMANLRQQLAQRQARLDEQQLAIDLLQADVEAQQAQLKASVRQADIRDRQLSRAQQELQQSKAQNLDLATSLSSADQRLQLLETQVRESRQAMAAAQQEADTLRQNLQQASRSGGQAQSQLAARLQAQEQTISELASQRQDLEASWQALQAERDAMRDNLALEVDKRSWLEVELASAKTKLAAASTELQSLEMALDESRWEKDEYQQEIVRLEQDLLLNRQRSEQDRRRMEAALNDARARLAGIDANVAGLERERARIASDVDLYSGLQQQRTLAMRGAAEPAPRQSITLPDGLKAGPYQAVIIANYDYDYLPDLSSPPFDANELKQVLQARYGFNVDVQINLNRAEMYKLLNAVRQFREDQFVLLYYAGHGKVDEFGDGYWLPTDYRPGMPYSEAVSSGDLTQTLQQSSARHVLVVADSCYSGALVRDTAPRIRKSIPALMKYWLANKSRTVLTSGGVMPVLDEGPDNHSVFASALLQVLQQNTGAINGEMIYAQVYDKVRAGAANLGYLDQVPQFAAIEDAGHENGQFVFVRDG